MSTMEEKRWMYGIMNGSDMRRMRQNSFEYVEEQEPSRRLLSALAL